MANLSQVVSDRLRAPRRCAGSSKVRDCRNAPEFDEPGGQCPWCFNDDNGDSEDDDNGDSEDEVENDG